MKETYHTNYHVAVHWLGNNFILCNEIQVVDPSVYDNMMPTRIVGADGPLDSCPDCGSDDVLDTADGTQVCGNCGHEWGTNGYRDIDEIYQWYLTDASEGDVEWLREHFGLTFTYSDRLNLYVLCVDHFGTGWDGVDWTTDVKQAERKLFEKK